MIGVVCAIAILSAGCKSKELEAPTPSSTQDVPAETAETEISAGTGGNPRRRSPKFLYGRVDG